MILIIKIAFVLLHGKVIDIIPYLVNCTSITNHLTLLNAVTLAPCSNNNSATLWYPFLLAIINGVFPY